MPGHLTSGDEESTTWGIDRSALMELLSTQLYPDAMAFVRELIANAVDATNRRPGSSRRIELCLSPGQTLEVRDEGCGLTLDEIRDLVGTIGASGTRHWYEQSGGPLPIGRFGVGLLSTRAVSAVVELFSQSENEATSVHWVWHGGAEFHARSLPRLPTIGTRVVVHFRPDSVVCTLDERSLARWVREEMPFIEGEVYLAGFPLALTSPNPPWRGAGDVSETGPEIREWAREHDLLGARVASVRSRKFLNGGALVFWPGEQPQNAESTLYRSGVRVPNVGVILSGELSWLRMVADLPGIEITLDRSSLTPGGRTEAQAELNMLALQGLGRLLVEPGEGEESNAWWTQHRAGLFRALAYLVRYADAQGDMEGAVIDRLCAWLQFDTASGTFTVDKLAAHTSRENLRVSGVVQRGIEEPRAASPELLIVRWNDEHERSVFLHLATQRRMRVAPWTPAAREQTGGLPTRRLWSGKAVRVTEVVRRALLKFSKVSINVTLADDFANNEELARWDRAPTSLVQLETGAFSVKSVRRPESSAVVPLELKLNADSPALQMLGDCFGDATENRAVGMAWALVGWALSKYAGGNQPFLAEQRRRQYNALFALMGAEPLPAGRVRCFVCYDWSLARAEFVAVREALSAPPFSLDVLDAASETQGSYILSNVVEMMKSCHCFVSILTAGQGPLVEVGIAKNGAPVRGRAIPDAINANVLLETGTAMVLGRPLILCCQATLTLPADFDGFLRVPYTCPDALQDKVRETATKLGLDRFGSIDLRVDSSIGA